MSLQARGILVVDDDPAILHLFTRILSHEGYTVESTTCPKEALGMVEAKSFDLVICDINMPEVTGLDIVRSLRRRDEDASAIIVTAAPHVNTAVEALELGAVRYLLKPVSFDCIRQVAREACEAATAKRRRSAAANAVDRAAAEKVGLDEKLSSAIEKLNMVYQPIVRWSSRSVFAYELLARCAGVFAHPGLLLDAAEELGRGHELSRALRGKSAALPEVYPHDARVFINIAPFELLDETLYQPENPLAPIADRVVLEITERGRITDVPELIKRIETLKKCGFGIAVDDLGAGYSGLMSFAKLAPDVVKIDMSLVRGIDKAPVSARLVRSVVEAGRDLGAAIVCEGVETPAEHDTLLSLGCDLFQGYLFAKPGTLPAPINWRSGP